MKRHAAHHGFASRNPYAYNKVEYRECAPQSCAYCAVFACPQRFAEQKFDDPRYAPEYQQVEMRRAA